MEQALKAITMNGISVRKAGAKCNIPKSTIYDRLCGKVLPGVVCGAPKYLSNSKEEELVSFLVGCAQIGFGKTRSGVILLVEKLLSSCEVEKEMPSG